MFALQPKCNSGPRALRLCWGFQESSGREPEFSRVSREALNNPAFWLVTVTAAIGAPTADAVGFGLILYLVEDVELSRGTAAGMLGLGLLLGVGNLGRGLLADLISPRRCLAAVSLVATTCRQSHLVLSPAYLSS